LKGGLRLVIAMYMGDVLYADCFFPLKMDCWPDFSRYKGT